VALSQETTGSSTVSRDLTRPAGWYVLKPVVVSGHGQAYKVEEGQGRKARVVLAPPGASENTESPATENQSPPPIVDRTEFYREGKDKRWSR
jgi:hypothetical protein